jgi:signal transduction histidine kinase
VAWLGGAAVILAGITAAWPVWSARGPALLADRGQAEYTVAPGWARLTDVVAFPLLVIVSAAAVASLVVRYRRAPPALRRQLIWFLATAVATVAGGVLLQVVPTAPGSPLEATLAVIALLVAPSIPLAVGAAILAHRLYEIDLVVNRALVYGGLVTLLTAAYVAVVAGVGALLPRDDVAVSLIATGLVAVAFAPVRARLQRAVNRLMYGDRDDPYTALAQLARSTGSAVEPRAVMQAVADTVSRALRVPYAAVELARPGTPGPEFEAVAAAGSPTPETDVLPLEHGGEPVGRLVVGRRRGGTFGADERRLLEDLARQAAPVVQAVRLTFDLQRSRQQLVEAREEERRRLRRTLHDQVGPALASSALKLGAVRRLLPSGSPAEDLVDELRTDLRSAVREIRTLAYDLRPPALDQLGLAESLAEFVERHRDAGDAGWSLPITVETDGDLPPLPAAVEVAAYWIAREALTNVVRHARARTARVRLAVDCSGGRRDLTVTAADDGAGLQPDAVLGVGTAAMRERAEELGGTLALSSSEAGTRVLARLPLGPVPP